MKTAALVIFIAVYVLMLALPKHRTLTALCAAAVFVIAGIVPLREAPGAIDWNVLMMLAGTMGTVYLCIESQMPARMADAMVNRLPSVKLVFLALAMFAGIVSAFIDNVATVLMVAPIGLAVAKKLNVSPVPVVLSIALSSNLQGAATLVGDTTSVLLAGHLGLDFADFFFFDGRPGMFFVTELGALATVPILLFLFRHEKGTVAPGPLTPVADYVPTYLLGGTVLALIAASFWSGKPAVTNGVICMAFFALALVLSKPPKGKKRGALVRDALKSLDFQTIGLLAGLFILIRGVTRVGLIDDLSALLARAGGDSVFFTYTLIVWGSVLFSAFIDNIPYTATMLPVVSGVAAAIGCRPALLCFGLLVGATLGGNLTPIGASANIAGCGILRREGHEVTTGRFMRMSVPFTLTAVAVGYTLVWLLFR